MVEPRINEVLYNTTMNQESRGIIMFNRGSECVVRAIVCLYTIRKQWNGPITFFVEEPYPKEFDEACKFFGADVIHNEKNHELKTLVRKTDMFSRSPYDRTLWVDADMVILGDISKMFDNLDEYDCCIPHFCGWFADGKTISKRIRRFDGLVEKDIYDKSLEHHKAVNTGILSWKKSEKWDKFIRDWVSLAIKGSKAHIFIPDEVAFQILYPSADKWGMKVLIEETNYNVSVLHDHGQSKDQRVIHFHGDKHVLDVPSCDIWKQIFQEMCDKNIANINYFVEHYADKRLRKYLNRGDVTSDVTIITACDEKYVEYLRVTFPNWVKYKHIDKYPVIVFVNGIPIDDSRLDFLRIPNVKLIQWDMPEIEEHREKMLSAFVFGTAEHVTTDFWLKMDADSYATDDRPIISEDMKQYAFCGHKWSYSKPEHIKKLDEWAKGHWRGKLKNAKPMIEEGKIEGRRFYHNTKRTISYIQLHKTKFTRFCVNLLRERRLPAPTQDTYMFFVCNRFDPQFVGVKNFKRDYGFTQGNSRLGVDVLKARVDEVDANLKQDEPQDAWDVQSDNEESVQKKETVVSKPLLTKFSEIHPQSMPIHNEYVIKEVK